MNANKPARIAADGDRTPGSSLDDIYREHGDWLRRLVGRRLRVQPAEADDIVQETWLRLARAPAEEVERPRALLSRIALNLFRDRRRRETVRAGYRAELRLVPQPEQAPDAMSEQEAALAIERLVTDMPEKWRDVFVLSRFRHLTNHEIASHLGVSIKTVEWRMGKALDYCLRTLRD
ncbi:sigma-70 family RNA polymerase sigma factor [Sphingomonas sp.]|uniref:RNA polymerase sigma factor n=1 Tax=Sphingomonas sp. TaxID=28214 RepID=UPI000DB775ED|nr:sigma-70 family RNA polymerase sigma factor [Sphingomonas sp.]PZU06731.1 MAG: RNA polymerase sigma factor [Sphingomonas sp.]